VVAIHGVLEARPTVSLTLVYDGRLIDDLQASRFLDRLKSLLENPQSLS
jgi:pyruvate/2-oxoglutarate dehydrogenase complex dihydrolipoamide acyltransferase (E2) component